MEVIFTIAFLTIALVLISPVLALVAWTIWLIVWLARRNRK